MTIPIQFLDELRQRICLSGLVARRVCLQRRGSEHVGLCPFHAEKTPSFTVSDDKGFFHCFGCGAHGDAIGFVMRSEGLEFLDAVERLAAEVGLTMPAPGAETPAAAPEVAADDPAASAERDRAAEWARQIWREAQPAAGSPVETYLKIRGIRVEALGGMPPTLRFHPRLWHRDSGLHFPGMVAPVQMVDRRVVGVHRTFLNADGTKAGVIRPKVLLGPCKGGAIRFAPPAPVIAIAEGIETTLSVMQARPGLAVWSVFSLTNFAAVELPEIVREVIVCADADNTDPAAAAAQIEKAARRFHDQERRVRIATPADGFDMNSLLTAPPERAAGERAA